MLGITRVHQLRSVLLTEQRGCWGPRQRKSTDGRHITALAEGRLLAQSGYRICSDTDPKRCGPLVSISHRVFRGKIARKRASFRRVQSLRKLCVSAVRQTLEEPNEFRVQTVAAR